MSGNRHVGSNPTLSAISFPFGSVDGGSGGFRRAATRLPARRERARIPPCAHHVSSDTPPEESGRSVSPGTGRRSIHRWHAIPRSDRRIAPPASILRGVVGPAITENRLDPGLDVVCLVGGAAEDSRRSSRRARLLSKVTSSKAERVPSRSGHISRPTGSRCSSGAHVVVIETPATACRHGSQVGACGRTFALPAASHRAELTP